MKLPNHLISAVFFILINSFCFSQDVKEVWKYTEQGKDLYVIDLEYDKKGNTYLLGVADDTLAVNTELQGEVTLYSTTKRTYFLEKLNHKGNLLWVKNLSEHSISKPEKFALNKSGEIVLLTSKSDGKNKRDYFLQIYTGEGKLILDKKVIKNVFYQNNIDVKQMILNDDNSIFVLGNFTKHLIIDGLKDTLNAFEGYDSDDFILKVSEKGEYKWIIKTTGRESARISQIESDKKGNVYFAGSFEKKCILGKDTLINDKEGNQLFFGKLNSKGEVETLKKFNRNYSSPSCIFPDEQGNVYLTGTFTKQIEEHNPTNPNWYYKRFGFITKLNSQFETIWIKKDSSSGWFYSEAKLSINKDSSIYWLGRFPANIDYDPSRVIFTSPRTNYNGNYDHDRVAVKHLSAKGEFLNMYLFPERNYFFYRLKILENQD